MPSRHVNVGHLSRLARESRLYLFRDRDKFEFNSLATGKTLLVWQQGKWWAPGTGQRGQADSPFLALTKAVELDGCK
jgi:hypothetical protein